MATSPRQEMQKVAFPRRGDIYLVHFDPSVGHEIQKTRPALIVQNDISNQYSPTTIVAAISSHFADPPSPREVVIEPAESGLPKRSAIVLNQIRSVDRQRLAKRLGHLSEQQMLRVDEALMISLGIVKL